MSDFSGFPKLSRRLKSNTARLKFRKYRELEGLLHVEGARLVADVLESGTPIRYVIVDEEATDRLESILTSLLEKEIPVYACSLAEFKNLADTVHSQGLLAVAEWRVTPFESVFANPPDSVSVALFQAGDPGNLGTIIRNCDWFGVRLLLLSPGSVDPSNPKTVRASMGSLFRVTVCFYP